MRTFATQSTLSSLVTGFPHVPWMKVKAYSQLLRFNPYAVSSDTSEDFGICPSALMETGTSTLRYAGWQGTSAYKLQLNINSTSVKPTIGTTQTSRVQVHTGPTSLRGSFDTSYNYWHARWSWDGNPTIYSNSTSVCTISYPMRDQAGFVRRVDGVYWTSLGTIVVIGSYDFAHQLATLRFFLVNGSSYVALDSIVQFKLTDTYTNWYSCSKISTYGGAAAFGGKLVVVTTDGARPLRFHINRGAESMLEPIVGLEPELTDHKILPTNLAVMGSRLYMSYAMKRKQSDDTYVNFAGYGSSDDGVNWSVGEHSSFIASTSNPIVLPGQSPGSTVYAVGGATCYTAPSRPEDSGASATDVTTKFNMVKVDMATSSLDQFQALVNDADPLLNVGNVVTLEAGLKNDAGVEAGGEIGRYVIVDMPKTVSVAGLNRSQMTALDVSGWKLKQWAAAIDVDRWSYTVSQDALADMSKMIIKLTQNDFTFAASGASSAALCDPFVGFKTTSDPRDGILQVRAKFTNPDTAGSLSTVGLAFGGSDDAYNVFLIPKQTSWSGHNPQQPKVLQSNLDPNNKWSVEEHATSIWETVLADEFAKLHTHPNASASGSDEYFYPSGMNGYITNDQEHVLFLRKAGRRVQVYKKRVATQLSDITTYSQVDLVAEYRFNEWRKMAHGGYWGLVAGTDVPASKEWFRQAQYGDMDQRLSSVSGDMLSTSAYNRNAATGTFNTATGTITGLSYSIAITFVVNQIVRINSTYSDAIYKILSIVGTTVTVQFLSGIQNTGSSSCTIAIYGPASRWGWANSSTTSSYNGTIGATLINNTGAEKHNELVYGRFCFKSDDNSAISIRYGVTDGVMTDLLSPGVNVIGWDYLTNPLESTQPGNSGSSPNQWSMKLNHGMFFTGDPSQYGLPSSAILRFKVDDEIIMGRKETFVLPGQTDIFTGVFIPTFYRPLAAFGRNNVTLRGWRLGSNQPGDNFDAVETAMGSNFPGLLAEITSRTASMETESIQYYTADAYRSGSDDYVTLDKPYPGEAVDLESMIVLSGRGQFGTTKGLHNADAPVRYYPSSTKIESLIQLKNFDLVTGLYNSTEDDLRSSVALAGVHDATFRDSGTWSGNLGTTVQTISAGTQQFSDFVLELNAHLFNDKFLSIYFRGQYRLDLAVVQPSTWAAQGRWSVLRAQLVANNLNGGTTLESAIVHDSDTPHFGTFSGTTYTDVPSNRVDMRVIVRGNLVTVELERQLLWQFNLERYTYDGGSAYYKSAGSVYMQYSASTSTAITARLQELSDEVENHVIDQGSSGTDAIGEILSDRHVKSRSTQIGGLEFSRFVSRDEANPIASYVQMDTPIDSSLEPVGHVNMVGAEMGEVVDDVWIIQNGYRFGMGNNKLLNTVQDSQREARIAIRDAKSYASQRQINDLTARLWMQPEDKFQIVYGGTLPVDSDLLPVEYRVADAVSFEIGNGLLRGTYNTRKHYD